METTQKWQIRFQIGTKQNQAADRMVTRFFSQSYLFNRTLLGIDMKLYSWLLVLLSGFAVVSQAAEVEVKIKNIASANGMLAVSLCTKEQFLKDCTLKKREKSKDEIMTFIFKDVPLGRYAVSAYHDENGNGKLDRNSLGIPIEGYAFSRDAKGHHGPPSFDDTVIDVNEGKKEIVITLNY